MLIIHSLSRFEGFIYNQLFMMRIIHRFFISHIIQGCILSTYEINIFNKTTLNDYYHLTRSLLGYKRDFYAALPLNELLFWHSDYYANNTM